MNKPFTYLFVGPPGSGKGTQAEYVAKELGIPHVDVGQLLRERAKTADQIGKAIVEVMKEGKTVPEETVLAILKDHLRTLDTTKGLVLDGYCRTKEQVHHLIDLQKAQSIPTLVVVHIHVPDNILQERVLSREYCETTSGEHILIDAVHTQKDCLANGGTIIKRIDDNATTFHERLETYHRQTEPAIAELQHNWQKTISIDGTPLIEEVRANLLTLIKDLQNVSD